MSMNMRVYEPSNLLTQLHREMNRLFDSPWGGSDLATAETGWAPPVDIREDQNHYVIRADVPGVEAKDIEITLENGVLSITGQRAFDSDKDDEGYRRIERFRGRFTRAFALPDTADAEKVNAKVTNGVLEVTINKKETSKPRKIAVNS